MERVHEGSPLTSTASDWYDGRSRSALRRKHLEVVLTELDRMRGWPLATLSPHAPLYQGVYPSFDRRLPIAIEMICFCQGTCRNRRSERTPAHRVYSGISTR